MNEDSHHNGSSYFSYVTVLSKASERVTILVDPVLGGDLNNLVHSTTCSRCTHQQCSPYSQDQQCLAPKAILGRHVQCDGDDKYGIVFKYKPHKKVFHVKYLSYDQNGISRVIAYTPMNDRYLAPKAILGRHVQCDDDD